MTAWTTRRFFEPTLQIIAGKGKVINDLRKAANSADAVYLAGDPDREGEAISAHLAMVLAKPSKFTEQEPSAPRFRKKESKAEEKRPEGAEERTQERARGDRSEEDFPRHLQRDYAQGDSRGV